VGLNDAAPLPYALDEVRRKDPNPERLLAFFQEYGFRSLAARVDQVVKAGADSGPSGRRDPRRGAG
jgi:hypothetical protein